MAGTRVEMSRQLQRNLNNIPDRFKRAVKGAIIKSALRDVESVAKLNCRVDTGRLRASIHTEYTRDYGRSEKMQHRYTAFTVGRILRSTTRNNGRSSWVSKIRTRIGSMEVIVGTDVFYGKKINRIDGFLINAYESSKAPMKREIQNAIRRLTQGGS